MAIRFQLLMFALSISLVSACGNDTNTAGVNEAAASTNETASQDSQALDPGPASTGNRGKAELTFSGGFEDALTGEAMHMTQETSAGGVFLLTIYSYQSKNDFTAISIVNMKGAASAGSHILNGDSDYKVAMMRKVAGVQFIGSPDSGELVINSTGSSVMSGSVSFALGMMIGADDEDVTYFDVEAIYEAVNGEPVDLPAGLR